MVNGKLRRLCKTIKCNQATIERLDDLNNDHTWSLDNMPATFEHSKSRAKMMKTSVMLQTALEYLKEAERLLELIRDKG